MNLHYNRDDLIAYKIGTYVYVYELTKDGVGEKVEYLGVVEGIAISVLDELIFRVRPVGRLYNNGNYDPETIRHIHPARLGKIC